MGRLELLIWTSVWELTDRLLTIEVDVDVMLVGG